MALHLNLDRAGRPYFALSCDGCGTRFACFDNACYHLGSLRTEAVYAGWEASRDPDQGHYCSTCVRSHNRSQPIPDQVTASAARHPD